MVKNHLLLEIFNEQLADKAKTEQGRKWFSVKDIAYVNTTNLYAAIEFGDKTIKAAMMMIKIFGRRTRWSYLKFEDEFYGKTRYFDNCPERILNLLTKPVNEESKQWRQYSWDRINKSKAFPKFKVGQVLVRKFDDGSTQDIYFIRKVFAKSLKVYKIDPKTMLPIDRWKLLKRSISYWLEKKQAEVDDIMELEIKTAMLSGKFE